MSANLSLRAWTPTPAALVVHLPVSSHKTSAFPALGSGRRLASIPCSDFNTGSITGLQSFANVQAHRFACHSGRSYHSVPCTPGSHGVSIRASHGSLPPRAPDMLAVRIRQLTAKDFHLIRSAALSAVPLTIWRQPPPTLARLAPKTRAQAASERTHTHAERQRSARGLPRSATVNCQGVLIR